MPLSSFLPHSVCAVQCFQGLSSSHSLLAISRFCKGSRIVGRFVGPLSTISNNGNGRADPLIFSLSSHLLHVPQQDRGLRMFAVPASTLQIEQKHAQALRRGIGLLLQRRQLILEQICTVRARAIPAPVAPICFQNVCQFFETFTRWFPLPWCFSTFIAHFVCCRWLLQGGLLHSFFRRGQHRKKGKQRGWYVALPFFIASASRICPMSLLIYAAI